MAKDHSTKCPHPLVPATQFLQILESYCKYVESRYQIDQDNYNLPYK